MIENPSGLICNRLHGHSRCKKNRNRERKYCSGTDDYCPSRDGFRNEHDFVGSYTYFDFINGKKAIGRLHPASQ